MKDATLNVGPLRAGEGRVDTKPSVSVVIPYYSEKYLINKAVFSVLSQSVSVNEILIVDDCSEFPPESFLEVEDDRIAILKTPQNLGGGGARNYGIERAVGRLVMLLDADDEWLPHKVETQLEDYRALGRDDVLLCSRCYVQSAGGSRIRPRSTYHNGRDLSVYLFCEQNIIQTSGFAFTKKMFENVRFAEIPRHQDYQFCLDVKAAGFDIWMNSQPLYVLHERHSEKRFPLGFSVSFYDSYGALMSEKGRKGFQANVIGPAILRDRGVEAYLQYLSSQGCLYAGIRKVVRGELARMVKKWL